MAASPAGVLAVLVTKLHPVGYLIAMALQAVTVIWIVLVTSDRDSPSAVIAETVADGGKQAGVR
jgi:hypothetical protein